MWDRTVNRIALNYIFYEYYQLIFYYYFVSVSPVFHAVIVTFICAFCLQEALFYCFTVDGTAYSWALVKMCFYLEVALLYKLKYI